MITARAVSGESLINYSYTFDGASNITHIDDNRSLPQGDPRQNTQVFAYDDLYRLTQARYPSAYSGISGAINYRYDRIGNMLSMTSDIPHEEKGLSVTNVGGMSYGAAKGSAGRTDGLAPGPHALTSASNGVQADRQYTYDLNGNIKGIQGLACTWDFKDRLVRVEDNETQSDYTYDYLNRRVVKRVANKKADPNDTAITIYVSRLYEVRQYDSPVKYVWNGENRVARISESLSGKQRVQRMRVHRGWNLLSPCIDTNGEQLLNHPSVKSAILWDGASQRYQDVQPNSVLRSGTVLWVFATDAETLPIKGEYSSSTSLTLPVGGHYVASSGFEEFEIPEESDLEYWSFQPLVQNWNVTLPAAFGGHLVSRRALLPGRPAFLKTRQQLVLQPTGASSGVRYYHLDHLGSTVAVTSKTGMTLNENGNYAFGARRYDFTSSGTSENYQFAQKEYEHESGLYNFERRYYIGGGCRFVSVDPLALTAPYELLSSPQGQNPYAYCRNSPLNRIDPTGCADEPAGGIKSSNALTIPERIIALGYGTYYLAGGAKDFVKSVPWKPSEILKMARGRAEGVADALLPEVESGGLDETGGAPERVSPKIESLKDNKTPFGFNDKLAKGVLLFKAAIGADIHGQNKRDVQGFNALRKDFPDQTVPKQESSNSAGQTLSDGLPITSPDTQTNDQPSSFTLP